MGLTRMNTKLGMAVAVATVALWIGAGCEQAVAAREESAGAERHEGHDHGAQGDHGEQKVQGAQEESGKGEEESEHEAHGDHEGHGEAEEKGEHGDHEGHGEAEEKGGHGEHAGEDAQSGLSVAKLLHAGVVFASAESAHVDDGVQLLGTIRPDGDRLAHVTPRFPGIVREVRVVAGAEVQAGDVMAVLESSDSLAPYELKALIAGTVIEKHLTRGESVDRDKQAFVVADLSTVWVNLSVYQKDLERVRVGDRVQVRAPQGETASEGTITYITPGVDEDTRTATARVALPNTDRRWRPGMFVVAYALALHPADLVVPTSAIQTLEGRTVVFVAVGDAVEPRPVVLGHRGETVVEVLDGLQRGERVATQNTFLLKAELGKNEAKHEH